MADAVLCGDEMVAEDCLRADLTEKERAAIVAKWRVDSVLRELTEVQEVMKTIGPGVTPADVVAALMNRWVSQRLAGSSVAPANAMPQGAAVPLAGHVVDERDVQIARAIRLMSDPDRAAEMAAGYRQLRENQFLRERLMAVMAAKGDTVVEVIRTINEAIDAEEAIRKREEILDKKLKPEEPPRILDRRRSRSR